MFSPIHSKSAARAGADEIRERMRRAGDDGPKEGLALARELWAELREFVQGVYVMPPFSRYEWVAELLDTVRVHS